MKRTFAPALLAGLILISTVALLHAEELDDVAAIEQAVLNYANSIYEMKPELIDASVSPKLQKLGFMPAKGGEGYEEHWMSFDQLRSLAETLNKGGMFDAKTAKREVKILDQMDQIAVVQLDAEWGRDYIHLVKQDGKWMLMNVVWQSYPVEAQ